MVIGFDGSRSFVKNKTGTENYAFQLLKHLAKIDQKNQYIIYLRPGNVVGPPHPNPLLKGEGNNNEPSPLGRGKAFGSEAQVIDSEVAQTRGARRGEGHNYGWPENFQFKMLNYPRLWTQLGLARQTFSDPLDVLFVPSHTLPLIRKPGLKTVMTVHDLGAEYLPGMHQLRQRLYLGLMTKIQLKTANKLIAVSEATKKDLIEKVGVRPEHIEVIYEGVNELKRNNSIHSDIDNKNSDTEKLDQNVQKLIKLYKNNYFLFVGTIQPRKNLERLIKAYAGFLNTSTSLRGASSEAISHADDLRLPRFARNDGNLPKLVLAGGKGWLSDQIYELPRKLGIERNVFFTGRVSDANLTDLYENALAFTFPSLFEGFGLPVLEAFNFGTPVITSNVSSLPEVAGDAALLVDPTKTEALIDALIKLYNDHALQKELVKRGNEQLKKFSWQKCAEETLRVLETV